MDHRGPPIAPYPYLFSRVVCPIGHRDGRMPTRENPLMKATQTLRGMSSPSQASGLFLFIYNLGPLPSRLLQSYHQDG